MALDRILPLKIESPTSGGTQEDAFPTDVNHNEDYADLRGVVFQDDSSDDELVYASRDASGNMTFTDPVIGETKTLTEVMASDFDVDKVLLGDDLSFLINDDGNLLLGS